MKKRVLAIILTALLIVSTLSVGASAAQTYTVSQLREMAGKYFELCNGFQPSGVDVVEESGGYVTLDVYELAESRFGLKKFIDARYKVGYNGIGNEMLYDGTGYKTGEKIDLSRIDKVNYSDVLFFLTKRHKDTSWKGAFSDINGDGTKELFVGGQYAGRTIYYLYTRNNGKVVTLIDGKDLCGIASAPSGMIGHVTVGGKSYFAHCDRNSGAGDGTYWNYFEDWSLYSISGSSLKKEIEVSAKYRQLKNGTYVAIASSGGIKMNGNTMSVSDYLSWVDSITKIAVTDTKDASGSSLAALLSAAESMKTPPIDPETGFSDVSKNEYYYNAVKWSVKNGITSGTSATTFGPNDNCTRAQFVTFLWRAAGKPEPKSSKNPFVDVPQDYYTKAVLWAVEKEIVFGTDATHFKPADPVQRSQAVTFLYRYAGKPKVSGANKFSDVGSNDYFKDAVLWGEQNGVVYGTSNTVFNPTGTCVRAQTVTFLYRYLGK